MTGFGTERQRSWRAFIAIVVAYAVAAQSLLLILGGLDLPGASENGQPVNCASTEEKARRRCRMATRPPPALIAFFVLRGRIKRLSARALSRGGTWTLRLVADPKRSITTYGRASRHIR
jgi:hypothetical protein